MAAILAGLVLAATLTQRDLPKPPEPVRPRALALALCALVGVATLGVSAWVQRDGNHTVNIRPAASGR